MTLPQLWRTSVKRRAWTLASGATAAWFVAVVFAAWSLFVLGVRYAEPILDGDLFWHLKYAEQMIAHGTLVPDPTIYSWTPTTNTTIYCSWLSELLLYGLYQVGGLAALFAFRYGCLALTAVLLFGFAWARGVRAPLPILAVILLSLLGSRAGTIPKPEIFSLVAFHALVFTYAMGRIADRAGGDPRAWFLAMPVIIAAWANAHGGFIFAAPFFAAIALGKALTRWLAPQRALSPRGGRALLLAVMLSVAAVLLTPYGWRYPAQLIADYLLHTGPRVGEAWNAAYQSILSAGLSEMLAYAVLMAVAMAGLAYSARRGLKQTDWSLLVAIVFYLPLFLLFVRTTFYLAVVFGYAALDLLAITGGREIARSAARAGNRRGARYIPAGCAAVLLLTGGSIALYSARIAEKGSWVGFGIGYVNPVIEAEFLAASKLEPRLYNIFDAGGYLLWRLDPAYKVMIDPRFFPYKDWFDDLYHFSTGETFGQFLAKYQGDTAIIDLDRVGVWRNFLQSPDWKLVFYGPTSAVFVPRSTPDDRVASGFAPDRFDHLRNGRTALAVFDFALVVGDYATAWKVLDEAAERLAYQVDPGALERAIAVRDGYRMLAAGNYDGALNSFTTAKSRPVQGWREPVILKLLEDRSAAQQRGEAVAGYDGALRELAIPMPAATDQLGSRLP